MNTFSLRNLAIIIVLTGAIIAVGMYSGVSLNIFKGSILNNQQIVQELNRLTEIEFNAEEIKQNCNQLDYYLTVLRQMQTHFNDTVPKLKERVLQAQKNLDKSSESIKSNKKDLSSAQATKANTKLSKQADEAQREINTINSNLGLIDDALLSIKSLIEELERAKLNCGPQKTTALPSPNPSSNLSNSQDNNAPPSFLPDYSSWKCDDRLKALRLALIQALRSIGNAYYDLTVDEAIRPFSIQLAPGMPILEFTTNESNIRERLRTNEKLIRGVLEDVEKKLKRECNDPVTSTPTTSNPSTSNPASSTPNNEPNPTTSTPTTTSATITNAIPLQTPEKKAQAGLVKNPESTTLVSQGDECVKKDEIAKLPTPAAGTANSGQSESTTQSSTTATQVTFQGEFDEELSLLSQALNKIRSQFPNDPCDKNKIEQLKEVLWETKELMKSCEESNCVGKILDKTIPESASQQIDCKAAENLFDEISEEIYKCPDEGEPEELGDGECIL